MVDCAASPLCRRSLAADAARRSGRRLYSQTTAAFGVKTPRNSRCTAAARRAEAPKAASTAAAPLRRPALLLRWRVAPARRRAALPTPAAASGGGTSAQASSVRERRPSPTRSADPAYRARAPPAAAGLRTAAAARRAQQRRELPAAAAADSAWAKANPAATRPAARRAVAPALGVRPLVPLPRRVAAVLAETPTLHLAHR